MPVTRTRLLRGFKILSLSFGVLTLSYCAWVIAGAAVYQARARGILETLRRQSADHSEPRSSSPLARGSVLASLDSPRIGLSVMVLEGTDNHTLRLGAGHLPGTGVLGEEGNLVIAGHRDTFFRPLRNIQVGDVLDLTSPEGTYRYEVTWTRVVPPDDTEALQPTRQAVLTLVTCYPFSYIGPAPDRLVIRAERFEPSVP
jgi:sortase A